MIRRGTPLPPPSSHHHHGVNESLEQNDTFSTEEGDDDDDNDDDDDATATNNDRIVIESYDDIEAEGEREAPRLEIDAETEQKIDDNDDDDDEQHQGATIVRNIASFLTLSDVASLASMGGDGDGGDWTPGDSWAVGTTWTSSVLTPPTPALVAVSPTMPPLFDSSVGHYQHYQQHHHEAVPGLQELGHGDGEEEEENDGDDDEDSDSWEDRLQQRRRKWAQERLAAAVFSHPLPLRSYCLEAYEAARSIRQNKGNQQRQQQQQQASFQYENQPPETLREPLTIVRQSRRRKYNRRVNILLIPIDAFFSSTPISVLFDVIDSVLETTKDTTFAVFKIAMSSIDALISTLLNFIKRVWNALTNFNPFELLDAFISVQFNAMGKTSEVLVSGIQSVATGVGSASNFALQRLSRTGGSSHALQQQLQQQQSHRTGSPSSTLTGTGGGLRRVRSSAGNLLNKKLMRRLSSINSAAEVVSYKEVHDDTGGLTKEAKKRVQRMMHYDISLRPFLATVVLPVPANEGGMLFENVDFPTRIDPSYERPGHISEEASSPCSSIGDSPFMCTPQSFPPTPSSRRLVMARGSRYVEDVVFLARDQLRVHDALESDNERTRAMANALREGKRLAVFNADDAASGIALTCGQHVATKVGNMLYCSTRSMVPVLRNCFVYFEVTVMPRPLSNIIMQALSMATLSIGLSTLEMPLNTLVGAWKGSVGLCTTGQILTAGQWCSPVDPSLSAYGDNATVGCLVCLDDGTAFETWEGLMVTAAVTFSVNGRVVSPPVSSMPMVSSIGLDGSMGADSVLLDPFQQARLLPAPPAPSSTLPLLVPADEELYATVSLHSPATSVMCRFSAEDVLATNRANIGAPIGVTVYAVDGSVIFER